MRRYGGMIGVVAAREEDEEDDGEPEGEGEEWPFFKLGEVIR